MTERRSFTGRLIAAGPTRTMLGEAGRYTVTAAAIREAVAAGLFRGLACFADHAAGTPSVRRLVGVWQDVVWDPVQTAAVGTLRAYETAATRPVWDLLAQWLEDEVGDEDGDEAGDEAGDAAAGPDLGVSLVFYPRLANDGRTVTGLAMVESADLVMFPACERARIVARDVARGSRGEREAGGAGAGAGQAAVAFTSWSHQPEADEIPFYSHSELEQQEIKRMTKEIEATERVMMQGAAVAGAAAELPEGNGQPGTGSGPLPPWGAAGAGDPVVQWVEALQSAATTAIITASGLPATVQQRLRDGRYESPEAVYDAVERARGELAAVHESGVVRLGGRSPVVAGGGHRASIRLGDPLAEARDLMGFFFGAAGATPPPANLRHFADLYVALTGDVHFRGVFDGTRLQFSGATTTTLADLAVDAMNKVIVQQFQALDHYRWYERIASVEPNDGRLHAMKWITLGGIGDLPSVDEGAAYTELSVADVKETAAFVKRGGYVGITREMIKNSDIMQLQAIPRALAVAAVRTRSAAVAALFTANSGVGPTLSQDSKALFHADHSNLATTALGTDAAAWRAARKECFKHAEVNSDKALGIFPRYLLVPADLYDTALSILGYGEGMPATYTPEAQDRGFADPRPVPLVVPDWTDGGDWAYIVDPAVYPVIQMSYSQAPGGRRHPIPELFAVVSETSGLMFTNDTLPIKVRDEFALGVNGHRGIGKRNVA